MGSCLSKPDIVQGAVITDSVVISNSRVHIAGDMIHIPIKDVKNGESAVIRVDRRSGIVQISRGALFGKLNHDMIVNDIEHHDKKRSPTTASYRYKDELEFRNSVPL